MMIESKITTILSLDDDRVQEEHRIGQKMMVEYITITHEDDGRVLEEQLLDQQMMIEYKRNNH